MAQQFGGRFSPKPTSGAPSDGPNSDGTAPAGTPAKGDLGGGKPRTGSGGNARPFEGRVPDISTARPNFLFLTAVPLLFTAFRQGAVGMAVDLAAFGTLVLGFWLLREGLRAEMAYHARTVARRPALPRKTFSMVLTAFGVALAAWDPAIGGGIASAVIFATLAAVLHFAAFGLDPMRDKGMAGIDPLATGRVADAVDQAEAHLAAMSDAIRRANDRDLESRVTAFSTTARRMFRRVEEDPRDLRAARKYLGVYLLGARDATIKFADLYARTRTPEDRARYVALLEDLDGNFAARSERLLLDDRSDMDIEIDVLRDRLKRETSSAN